MDTEDGTVPLDKSFEETLEHHGRSYQKHAVTNGVYFGPVDEEEVAHLELMHSVLCRLFDGRLIFPPVNEPKRILDCGFGAGDWALDVARAYPDCEVIGVDICPNMIPEDQPENLVFQIDDLNARFTFSPGQFDVVHSQMMSGGINASRWHGYVQDIFRVLRPGGWCQMVEIYFNAQSDNGTLHRAHALSIWSCLYLDAMHPMKDTRAALQLKHRMTNVGFTDVESRLLMLPMCPWPADERNRDIGSANAENVAQLLHSLALYPFTKLQKVPLDPFMSLIKDAREEAANPLYKAYFPLYVCIGRKPEA